MISRVRSAPLPIRSRSIEGTSADMARTRRSRRSRISSAVFSTPSLRLIQSTKKISSASRLRPSMIWAAAFGSPAISSFWMASRRFWKPSAPAL
jgi:hypothetical protein